MKLLGLFTLPLLICSASFADIETKIITTLLTPEGKIIKNLGYFTDSIKMTEIRSYCYDSDIYDACRALASDIRNIRIEYAEGGTDNILLKSCEIRGVTVRAKYMMLNDSGGRPIEKNIYIQPCSGL